ncbi:MAG: NADH-quinone oxidoreductase subunit NuoH [Actinobacteria bacterium]|nr:NADH-quinone oxidoreductase subunit NuoH [Actinomycetota bacterium]
MIDTINNIFGIANKAIGDFAAGFLPTWVAAAIMALIAIVAALVFLIVVVMLETYLERRVLARMQDRWGPNRVGPWGLLQPIADVLKLLMKEDIRPNVADKWVFFLAPCIVLIPSVLAYAVIPFGHGMQVADINIGLLFLLALGSIPTIGVVLAGWGSANKYSVLGGMRAAAQMISFEIPLLLSLISPILIVGSLSMVDIVKSQTHIWYIVVQPVAFLIYYISGLAEGNRSPFDIPEAESELVAGYHIEYSGMRWALFFLAEYMNAFTVAAIATTVFLGGWQPLPLLSFIPGYFWFTIKAGLLFISMIWVRASLPRLRVDQLMAFNWKVLVPISLANLVITGIGVSLWQYFVG